MSLRTDRPPVPECEHVHMRARLADGAIVPGWPLPRNDSTDAARELWRKIVLFSSELRGFAPSREFVIMGRPGLPPTSTIACRASQTALTTSQPGHDGPARWQQATNAARRGGLGRTADGRSCLSMTEMPWPNRNTKYIYLQSLQSYYAQNQWRG